MPKLKELESSFLTIASDHSFRRHDSLADAQGIMFLCPKCFADKNGPVGVHSVICWFNNRGVPPEYTPGPGRWNPAGTGYDDLTFVGPGATSVWLTGTGCGWHGHVANGEAA